MKEFGFWKVHISVGTILQCFHIQDISTYWETTNPAKAEDLSGKIHTQKFDGCLQSSPFTSSSSEAFSNFPNGWFICVLYHLLFKRPFINYWGIAYGARSKLSKMLYISYILCKQRYSFSINHIEFASINAKPSDRCIRKVRWFLWSLCRYFQWHSWLHYGYSYKF